MAFTDAQKENIRFYLGYPQVYLYANPRLESAINVVGNSATLVDKVQGILDKLDATQDNLSQAQQTAGLKRAEDIEWYGNTNQNVVGILNAEGKKFCTQLSIIFGVPIANNVFAQGGPGYSGDTWRSANGMSNGFGFNINFS